jgi:hypothetical protein
LKIFRLCNPLFIKKSGAKSGATERVATERVATEKRSEFNELFGNQKI